MPILREMQTLILEVIAGWFALSLGAIPGFMLFGRFLHRNEESAVEAYELAYIHTDKDRHLDGDHEPTYDDERHAA